MTSEACTKIALSLFLDSISLTFWLVLYKSYEVLGHLLEASLCI